LDSCPVALQQLRKRQKTKGDPKASAESITIKRRRANNKPRDITKEKRNNKKNWSGT
jgi:hypothetical protein